jgi:uncharacterized membrane protein
MVSIRTRLIYQIIFAIFLIVQYTLIAMRLNGTVGGHWALTFTPFWIGIFVYLILLCVITVGHVKATTKKRQQPISYQWDDYPWTRILLEFSFLICGTVFLAMLSIQQTYPGTFSGWILVSPLLIDAGMAIIICITALLKKRQQQHKKKSERP